MRIIRKIRAKTPQRDKAIGKISTVIGTTCATILALGLVVNPVGLVALTVGSVIFGGKALFHATKTVEDVR